MLGKWKPFFARWSYQALRAYAWLMWRAGRVIRWTLAALGLVYFVCAIIFLALRYVVLPNIDAYRPDIERLAGQALGVPVRIADVDASWYGLQPRLTLKDVELFDQAQRAALRLPRVDAALSWQSLFVFDLRLASLQIDGADLDIRRDRAGRLTVAGLPVQSDRKDDGALNWLLHQHEIVIRNARIRWNDEQRAAPELPLEKLTVVLRNRGLHHRFLLQATPPAALAAPLDIRGDFTHPIFTRRVADYRQWQGQAYVRLTHADLTAGKTYIDYPLDIQRGSGALQAWLQFDAMQMESMTADLNLQHVVTRLRKDLPLLGLQTVQGRIKAGYQEAGAQTAARHHLQLQGLNMVTSEGLKLPTLHLDERYQAAYKNKPEQGSLKINAIDLRVLANLAERLPLPAAQRELLHRYQPRGTLNQVDVTWQGDWQQPATNPEKDARTFRVLGSFSGLSLQGQPSTETYKLDTLDDAGRVVMMPKTGVPGFANLSGRLDMDQTAGSLQIDSTQAMIVLPGVFEEADIPAERLQGTVSWKKTAQQISAEIKRLNFSNADATGYVTGTYTHPLTTQGSGSMHLQGELTRAEGIRIVRYLPQHLIHTRGWLKAAVQAGKIDNVEFTLRGDPRDFPFPENKKGLFRISAHVTDGWLQYAPRWPALEKIRGTMLFEGAGMQLHAEEALTQNVKVGKVAASISNLADPHATLVVDGTAGGPLQNMVQFVNKSPVAEWTYQFTEDTTATGNAKLALNLQLPINDVQTGSVKGSIDFDRNDVVWEPGFPMIERAQGRLEFTEKILGVKNVTGQFLGGTLKLNSETRADNNPQIRIEGTATAAGLQTAYGAAAGPLLQRIIGNTRYTGRVVLRKRMTELQIDSNLVGLGIDLPAPLRKAAGESLPWRFESQPQVDKPDAANQKNADRQQYKVSFGRAIQLLLERGRNTAGDMVLSRGVLAVNETPVLPDQGLSANLNLQTVNLDEWRRLLARPAASSQAGPGNNAMPQVELDTLTVRAQEFTAFGKTMQNVTVGASRNGRTWQANLDADQFSGYLNWRLSEPGTADGKEGKLIARLARLTIPASNTSEVNRLLDSAPQEIPAIDLLAEEFNLQGKRLGQLEVQATNLGTGNNRLWRLQKLSIQNPDATLNATGAWALEPFGAQLTRRTSLNFTLDIENAGRLLERFGIKDALRNGKGKMEGDITWRGVPFSIDFPSLSGKVQLNAEKGQFLKADPGIAKLLGVLSLQALPRRIALDFRDVFSEGFAFNNVLSGFVVENGVATTKDFKMKGVAATVTMQGTIDLAHETQKLHVIVLPELSGGVASLAWGLLTNPAVGVASFLAQLLLKEPLAKAFSYEYDVTGTWAEPNVVKRARPPAPNSNSETNESAAPQPATTNEAIPPVTP